MSRLIGSVVVIGYVLACFGIFAIWLPNFFAVNVAYSPEISWRYLAACGVPFGLLLVTVIARQSLKGFFSPVMLFQVLFAGSLLYAGLFAFYFPLQANFFCAAHLWLCAAAIVWNLYRHRKELALWERSRAAAAA